MGMMPLRTAAAAGGTYFKQKTFSSEASDAERDMAMRWSVLYLAFVVFKLDERLPDRRYVVHMGMPTSADPDRYNFCKRQAVRAMAAAMRLARDEFRGDLSRFLQTSHEALERLVAKCVGALPQTVADVRKEFPILVLPEAYASLIPLINDRKLPTVGPSLLVDIGGGTVDISLFTNEIDRAAGKDRPRLYHYLSVPYGLNRITGQNVERSHVVKVEPGQITRAAVDRFRQWLTEAIDSMMQTLKTSWEKSSNHFAMPISNLCRQMLDGRPVCYSGGGSLFPDLRLAVEREEGFFYRFTDCKTVSELIDHSKLYVKDRTFPVLATAFALSHSSLQGGTGEPDAIDLAPLERLFGGVRLPQLAAGMTGGFKTW